MDNFLWFMAFCGLVLCVLADFASATDSDRQPVCYYLIMLPVLILKELKKPFSLTKKSKSVAVYADNSPLGNELKLLEEIHLRKCKAFGNYENTGWKNLMLTLEKRITDLQELNLKERTEKSKADLDKVKMVKSMETFNLCSELVLKNQVLVKAIKEADEPQGVLMLQRVFGFSPQEAESNRQMLLQIVRGVKRYGKQNSRNRFSA